MFSEVVVCTSTNIARGLSRDVNSLWLLMNTNQLLHPLGVLMWVYSYYLPYSLNHSRINYLLDSTVVVFIEKSMKSVHPNSGLFYFHVSRILFLLIFLIFICILNSLFLNFIFFSFEFSKACKDFRIRNNFIFLFTRFLEFSFLREGIIL